MSKQVSLDPQKRQRTRYRGITYRVRADGSKSYAVTHRGKYVPGGATEKEALAVQANLRARQARGEKVVVNDRTTFAELAEQWFTVKAGRLRKYTLAGYRSSLDLVLLPRFGDWRITAIDAEAISRLIRDLERKGLNALDPKRRLRPLRRATIENHLRPLQGTLALAVRSGLIPANPFDHLTVDDRPQPSERKAAYVWSDEEIEALLTAAQTIAATPNAKYDYTELLLLTARLGLRLGEVTGLQWGDFDKDENVLHVRRQWTRLGEYQEPKTNSGKRRIPLSPDLRELLIARRLRSEFARDEDPIFASLAGTPLTHRNATKRGFEAARDLAGITGVSFHDLRHAAASRLIEAGLSPVVVATILGHTNPSITLRVYAHVFDRQKTDHAVRLALAGASSATL